MNLPEPGFSSFVLLNRLKSLTVWFFFAGAGVLILALCFAAIDWDGLFWAVPVMAVLVRLTSLAYFATAIRANAQEGLPLSSSDLCSLGLMGGLDIPVWLFCAMGLGLGQSERGMIIFLVAGGLSALLSATQVLVGFAFGRTP